MTGIEIFILALILATGIALVISGHRDEKRTSPSRSKSSR